jgi:hypothetical protein
MNGSKLMGNCPRCFFRKWLKTGKRNKQGIQYFKCGRCGKVQLGDLPFERSKPKILYIDIETSLTGIRGNFGTKVRGEYINPSMIKHKHYIICWSALWVGTKKIYSACVTQEDALAFTDRNIMWPLWDLIDSADIVAGHNINKFDLPDIHTSFLCNGMPKPSDVKTYDTLPMARKKRFESNTLNYLFKLFGLPCKDKMTMDDWLAIEETGDPKTLKKMLKYNRGDVRNGAKVLEILLGYTPPPAEYGQVNIKKEPKDIRKC